MTKTEINTLFKEYPEEMEDMSLGELKVLMSLRLKMMGITKWDQFQDEFVDDLRKDHNDYLLNLGHEADKKQMAEEGS
jgi:hypothetical protein